MDNFTPSDELKEIIDSKENSDINDDTDVYHSTKDIENNETDTEKEVLHVLFAAGGTGGHLFPAIAVAEELKELTDNKIKISFIGTKHRIEAKVVPELGYDFYELNITGYTGFNFEAFLLPIRVIRSIIKSRAVIKVHKVNAVVCTGAYISYPPGMAAKQLKKKLYLMESNVNVGKSIKMLSEYATKIFTSFDKTADFFDDNIKTKMINLGNPVRKYIKEEFDPVLAKSNYGLDPEKTSMLIMGGSLGALSINKAVLDNLIYLNDSKIEVIWQTGKGFKHSLKLPPNVHQHEFIYNMAEAYAAVDFVFCRSGATTVSEITITGKPSILVPLPSASNKEQQHNAEYLVDNEAGIILDNQDVSKKFKETIELMISDKDKMIKMSENAKKLAKPNAARDIATQILSELSSYDPYSE
jgi:UDP-N-acetylglucosamine--N-acetylmuramyl-(pentapeptide) pyrophosphoryl-undecaprenol N-acetylglucosamine transferase